MTDTTELRRRLRADHSDPEHVRKHGPDAPPHERCRVCALLTALDAEDAARQREYDAYTERMRGATDTSLDFRLF